MREFLELASAPQFSVGETCQALIFPIERPYAFASVLVKLEERRQRNGYTEFICQVVEVDILDELVRNGFARNSIWLLSRSKPRRAFIPSLTTAEELSAWLYPRKLVIPLHMLKPAMDDIAELMTAWLLQSERDLTLAMRNISINSTNQTDR